MFDLSREFPPLRIPARPAVDIFSVKLLLVEAAKSESNLKTIIEKGDPGSEVVTVARR